MTYNRYHPEGLCPKCGFPFSQIYRQFHKTKHNIMIEKEISECKVTGEHIHMECACGYEMIFRPLDWKTKKGEISE